MRKDYGYIFNTFNNPFKFHSMKSKIFMTMALAASMVFVACDNDEENGGVPKGNSPKSVTINLANVTSGTRSAGGEDITEGTAIPLTKFQVFFTDGTKLYKGKDSANSAELDGYINVESDESLTQTFHFLPAAVTEVIVIGNREKIGASTEAELNEALKDLNIGEEQDTKALTLYAKSGLTNANEADEADNNPLYTATLNLAPTIARLYVEGFTCNFDEGVYKSLDMMKLALNNYYESTDLDVSGDQVTSTPKGSDHNITVSTGTVWDWFADLEALESSAWNYFSYDDLTGMSLTPDVPTAASDLYYHFFVGSEKPQLVLQCKGDDGTPLYLPTLRFTQDGEEVVFQPGYIYKMNFSFDESDFKHPDKCVDITVETAKWQVVTVTPEF